MDTRYSINTRRHTRGAVRPIVIAIVAVVALLAVGAWFLIIKPHQELVMADAGGHPSTPVAAVTRTAPPPANVAAMDIDQLLGEARKAMNEQRYLAPTGNNAFEFYLRVLQKEPANRVASDALRETFPFAANSAEAAINGRDFNEAQRQIDLLAKADPANFTLTILRSKLDAQRKLLDKQQQQAVDQEKAQQLAAAKAAADKAAAEAAAAQQRTLAATQEKQAAAEPARTPASRPKTPAADTGTVATTGKTSDAVLVKAADPSYPSAALRSRQSGWVIVSFTVGTDGKTQNVHVTSAKPRRVFDRAAIEAVSRYQFTPAMKSGVAVTSVRTQRIEFNL